MLISPSVNILESLKDKKMIYCEAYLNRKDVKERDSLKLVEVDNMPKIN